MPLERWNLDEKNTKLTSKITQYQPKPAVGSQLWATDLGNHILDSWQPDWAGDSIVTVWIPHVNSSVTGHLYLVDVDDSFSAAGPGQVWPFWVCTLLGYIYMYSCNLWHTHRWHELWCATIIAAHFTNWKLLIFCRCVINFPLVYPWININSRLSSCYIWNGSTPHTITICHRLPSFCTKQYNSFCWVRKFKSR